MRILILASVMAVLFNTQSSAGNCPEFFRFVDFGLRAPDGTMHRGGPTFRAEGFNGSGLLIRQLTLCRAGPDLAVDGHGNPIPVVTSVTYNPERTNIDLKELRLFLVEDLVLEIERSAAEHRARLEHPKAILTRGDTYLCAGLEGTDSISCQLASPFGGNLALVVYCEALECKMPMLRAKENVVAMAIWRPSQVSAGDHDALASEIIEKVQEVHDFLAPLSS